MECEQTLERAHVTCARVLVMSEVFETVGSVIWPTVFFLYDSFSVFYYTLHIHQSETPYR